MATPSRLAFRSPHVLSSRFSPSMICPNTSSYLSPLITRHYSQKLAQKMKEVPSFGTFLRNQQATEQHDTDPSLPSSFPSINKGHIGEGRNFFIETYGCQMNVSDSEIVQAVLEKAGFGEAKTAEEADVVLLNTCAIREKAEQKIWERLNTLKIMKVKEKTARKYEPVKRTKVVGVLGCMAERLKNQLLESDKLVDLVVGPDAYRSLPALLAQVEEGQQAMNVQLSMDETYADISPVRRSSNSITAYVSIMRGCNNVCSFCIVPFTRGRERSRDVESIVAEIKELSSQGFKEVVLLGQNVNSYNDTSQKKNPAGIQLSKGFKNNCKPKEGGLRFSDLMERVAQVDPEMRIRFTSPHPKDFPDELLDIIRETPNICNSIHIPAQSGNTEMLMSMRRNHSRESYLELIQNIRAKIPNVGLSSDFISGFCGETEEAHIDTVSLLKEVRYDQAFMFAYSMREKTKAHRRLIDDVPEEVKKRRLSEVINMFHSTAKQKVQEEIGVKHLVLVEGVSRKSDTELIGRTDNNKRVVFSDVNVPVLHDKGSQSLAKIKAGDYVVVRITETRGLTLSGDAEGITTIAAFNNM